MHQDHFYISGRLTLWTIAYGHFVLPSFFSSFWPYSGTSCLCCILIPLITMRVNFGNLKVAGRDSCQGARLDEA